jgi:hypothetical protein
VYKRVHEDPADRGSISQRLSTNWRRRDDGRPTRCLGLRPARLLDSGKFGLVVTSRLLQNEADRLRPLRRPACGEGGVSFVLVEGNRNFEPAYHRGAKNCGDSASPRDPPAKRSSDEIKTLAVSRIVYWERRVSRLSPPSTESFIESQNFTVLRISTARSAGQPGLTRAPLRSEDSHMAGGSAPSTRWLEKRRGNFGRRFSSSGKPEASSSHKNNFLAPRGQATDSHASACEP